MEKELYIKQLKPFLYLMDEAHEATGYIVVGDERVCVIDTMNGYNDLHKVVREITDKPIVVVNTHGHPDHIFGNVYFDEAYMNPKDFEMASSFFNEPEFVEICNKKGFSVPPLKPIKGGDVILHGHATGFDDISLLRCMRQGAVEICNGETENDLLYNWFGGVAKQHPFKLENDKEYDQTVSVICYR